MSVSTKTVIEQLIEVSEQIGAWNAFIGHFDINHSNKQYQETVKQLKKKQRKLKNKLNEKSN